jgi:Xaa-Pro dipeptidase
MAEMHAARRDRLRALLAEHDADAALVTHLVNVRYLTGLTAAYGVLLVLADDAAIPGGAVVGTVGTEASQAALDVPELEREVSLTGGVPKLLVERAAKAGVRRLAVEGHDLTIDAYDALAGAAGGVELVRPGRLVEALRVVKDEAELAALTEACAITDRAFADLLASIRPGRTERELARALDDLMFTHGADEISFETIVAAGTNGAVPHHRPTRRPVETGDLIVFDFGAAYAGYHADMTRTVALGTPARWQREIYDVVSAAARTGREALRAGIRAADVDRASRKVVEDAGYGEQFVHGLGHGVGLEVHEDPGLGKTSEAVLAASSPVTVEPGVYLPGGGGVRIEDTLVVRADSAESLTRTTRELIELGAAS